MQRYGKKRRCSNIILSITPTILLLPHFPKPTERQNLKNIMHLVALLPL